MITTNMPTLHIHKLSQEQYDRELAAGKLDENAIYLTPDEGVGVFIAKYGSTTSEEIEAAYQAGAAVFCEYKNALLPMTYHDSSASASWNFTFGVSLDNVMYYEVMCKGSTWDADETMVGRALPPTQEDVGKVLVAVSAGNYAVASAATARTNLDVYSKAEVDAAIAAAVAAALNVDTTLEV